MADGFTIGSTCYKLYPVWDNDPEYKFVIYSQLTFLAGYVNDFASVQFNNAEGPIACYFVVESTECISPINTLLDGNPPCNPEPSCYAIGGEGTVTYIDSSGDVITTYAPTITCSKTIPEVISNGSFGILHFDGTCTDDSCEITCYELIDCSTGQRFYSKSQALLTPFVLSQTVTLEGYDGCYTIERGIECSCEVDVVIKKSFDTCEDCLPTVAYKLTNCTNSNRVQYTTQDLSTFVGKTVLTACNSCWSVTTINFQPPSTTTVTIVNTYDSCIACTRPYWILDDCDGIESSIITYTDMTQYVNKTIKLLNSSTCWNVSTTLQYNNAIAISVATSYDDCTECRATANCICTKVVNGDNTSQSYSYTSCEGATVNFTLLPTESSGKICVNVWLTKHPTTDIVTTFGDCVENPNTHIKTCPVIPSGRVITPGYSVPACSIEKYEEYACKSSEVLYKQVLQQRYGIANCCPDDDQKWLLKMELTDLKSMLDPNYVCELPDACCSPSPCGCATCVS